MTTHRAFRVAPFAAIFLVAASVFSVAAAAPLPAMVDTSLAALRKLEWKQRAPGVWSATVGSPEIAPLSFAAAPRLGALKELGEAPLPPEMREARGDVFGRHVSVRLPLAPGEKVYGLGMQFDAKVDRRSQVYELQVDWTSTTPGHSHAPVPLYISSRGYGILFNVASPLKIYAGAGNHKDSRLPDEVDRTTGGANWSSRPVSDALEASVTGRGMEVILFAGPGVLPTVQRYNLYCGGGCLPPRWGLGFWQRVHTKSSAADVLREADEFAAQDCPLDVIGLEPGWQSAAYPCTYEWDATRFPNPGGLVTTLRERGIELNLWENTFISKKSPIYGSMQPYLGSHTVWLGVMPDFTLKGARDIWLEHHRKVHGSIGISGYKIDEVDNFQPAHARFPSGLSGEQMLQIHGIMMQQIVSEEFRRMNRRTYGLVRASNAGASSYGFVLYSDQYEHRGYVRALINSSLAGVLWVPEVRSGVSDEDWVRRFQTMLFSPMMQLDAWSSGLKPWSRPAVTDIVRDLMKLRQQLLPYLYTAFADYQRRGIPPIRHMILEADYKPAASVIAGQVDGETNPYGESAVMEVSDQYMFGPSILVAPLFAGEKSRKVVLPHGKWFDFYTGKLAGDGGTITASASLKQMPLYVKDGGIIPLMPAARAIRGQQGPIPLEVRHYGTKESGYELYDDDGETFDFEKGIYSRQELRTVHEGKKLKGVAGRPFGPWKPRYGETTWRFMTPMEE
jgi:alpha-D-xyloside xylohydrolase